MKILCVGQLVADVLVRPVGPIDFHVDTVCVDRIEVSNGGDCMNVAVGLARLGCQVQFVGKVGEDDFGRLLRARLDSVGIDHSGLLIDHTAPTSSTIVLINEAGDRVFLHCPGANQSLCAQDAREECIADCGLVFVGGTFLLPRMDGDGTAALFQRAKQHGAITAMDVTHDPSHRWMEVIRPCLAHLDYFLPSIAEAEKITGRTDPETIADVLLGQGVGTAVIKLGNKGCYVKNRSEQFYHTAYPTQTIDTTGAGDSFVAGFLTGLSLGRPLKECAGMGCAAGSVCVGHFGATTEALTKDVLEALMRSKIE